MVTLIKYGTLSGGVKYNVNQMWICGTGSKPTTTIDGMPIPNGSVYTEVDTGKNFMFDYDNTTWYEVSIGGGGGTSGGIVLVGETTTQLVDNATTNPITVDGQSYTAQPNDAVIYGSKEFLFDGTKWHEFGDLSGLSSKDIGAMTNYVKAQTGAAITTTDTLNQAIGKVEKRVDDNETNILLLHDDIYNDEAVYTDSETIAEATTNKNIYIVYPFKANTKYKFILKFTDVSAMQTANAVRFYTTTATSATYIVDELRDCTLQSVSANTEYSVEFTTTGAANYFRLRFNVKVGSFAFVLSQPINQVDKNTNDIAELKNVTENLPHIPSYLSSEIERVKKAVMDNAELDAIVFGVYTDIHFPTNSKTNEATNIQKWGCVQSLAKIANETILDFSIQGGDLCTYGTYDGDTYTLNRSQYEFSNCRAPIFTSKGDHDSAQTDTQISLSDFAERTRPYMPINVVYSTLTPNDYYFDIPYKKVRFINIDTGSSESGLQGASVKMHLEWLIDSVFTDDVKDGWRFVVWSHAPIDYEWNVGMCRKAIMDEASMQYVKPYPIIADLFSAINNNQSFGVAHTQETRTVYFDAQGTLVTQAEATTSMDMVFAWNIESEVSKSFANWTSKVRLVSSGHCHCDRLNAHTNGVDINYGISYTGSASCTGYKTESQYHYYSEVFGTDGVIAKWLNLEDRTYGTVSEDLMDVFIVNSDNIKRIRFGCGDENTPSIVSV